MNTVASETDSSDLKVSLKIAWEYKGQANLDLDMVGFDGECEPYSTQLTLHMCPPSVIKCSICSHLLPVCLDTCTCTDRDLWLKCHEK